MTARNLVATALALLLAACGGEDAGRAGTPISANELAGRLRAGSAPVVLDVRTAEEYASGHIPGSINVPHDELPQRIPELSIARTEEIVVHCQSGRRAEIARDALGAAGYSNVRDLSGHWQEWLDSGLPTE